MDEHLIQRSRYVLRSRVRNAQTCPKYLFPSACAQLLEWLSNHPILNSIIHKLSSMNLESRRELERIISHIKNKTELTNINLIISDTTIEHAALCLHTTKAIKELSGLDKHIMFHAINLIATFLTNENHHKIDESIEPVRDVAIDGLYEFLDEQLDSRIAIYGLLLKYKQKVEWFSKNQIRDIAVNGLDKYKGERALTIHLQEFVFDQGVEFMIEPTSSSGEVDLILRSSDGKYLVIDAKYISDNSSRSEIITKLSSGFHQVMRYCEDYNESEGFLVTFLNTNKRISIELDEMDGFPYLTIGSKIIYHLFVNIYDEPSASKSGKAEEVLITHEELKSEIKT